MLLLLPFASWSWDEVLTFCSFFGDQEGPFNLHLVSIAALRTERYMDYPDDEEAAEEMDEKFGYHRPSSRGWFGWLTSCLGFNRR